MKFTDIFIRRPVLATVISLMIFIVGLRAFSLLDVRQYPQMKSTVVTISTFYPGADSELVNGFVTTPLQQAIAEAAGIDYIFATSTQGLSRIEVRMKLNYDSNAALAEIQSKVASKRNVLPDAAEDSVIESTTGDQVALMYIAFYSKDHTRPQVTDYLTRVVQPQIQSLPGVAKARIMGQPYALRVWLDPQRMAALGITAEEVAVVLRKNNFLAGIGATKDKYIAMDLAANTHYSDPAAFGNLVVRNTNNSLVRLRDIAKSELGAEDYNSSAWYKGIPAVFIAVENTPASNPLTVAQLIHNELPQIRTHLPKGMETKIPYDASQFIQESIDEVLWSLLESIGIVLVVIFLTLGTMRAALIPAITVPLSLIGAAFIMLLLGYSINLLTLLAMILAIGLVVDDAIVVVENVHRHIELGKTPLEAAFEGARELALPIIAMTTTLLAVYAPIGFLGGLVGTLFTEFAFTLAAAVLISGVVALTLSPMLAARVLKPRGQAGHFEQRIEHIFNRLANTYRRLLQSGLQLKSELLLVGAVILISNFFMFYTSKTELAPTEDQSILFVAASAPQTSTLDYHEAFSRQIQQIYEKIPEYSESFFLIARAADTTFTGFRMKPVRERKRSQSQIQFPLMGALQAVAGFQTVVFPRPSIPGTSGGLPIQFVLVSGLSFEAMDSAADEVIARAMPSGRFLFLKKSVDVTRPVVKIDIDRDRAGDLGVSMEEIGRNLSRLLGGGYVNMFSMQGRSYKVIPQAERRFRLDDEMLKDYYVRAGNGQLVPMASLLKVNARVLEPSKRTQFQQLNSITVEGIMMPGTALGDALVQLEKSAREVLPQDIHYDYSGESRQFAQQGSAFIVTLALALVIIYLLLAVQFESWRDPLIILVSVPLGTAGALVFIWMDVSTINIYTKVGLITLIGVVAKNGIMIVEFANQLQIKRGLSKLDAVVEAATIRFRPIFMTTIALIAAMIPLLISSGPGAKSRFDIGLTVAAGLGIGTLFTLFVLPAVYVVIAKDHSKNRGDKRIHGV